jgi:poly-beta-1,6-N-acetyl-D-glucosamine synthase
MVKPNARRALAITAAAGFLGAAAFFVHRLSHHLLVLEGEALLGPVSHFIVAALFAFLVLLACRHLCMLGLATWDHWRHAGDQPEDAAGRSPTVSVIVPAYNEGAMIAAVLESLFAIDYPNFEIIVVDDGSTDRTYLRALPFARRRPDIECRVLAKPNGGKFDALNHGIAHARGEFVVCIDGDSLLDPQALKYCIARFADPRIGAVAGNVRVANRRSAWSAMQALEYIAGYGLTKRAQSAAGVVTIVPGPLGAFRKCALEAVRGYDGDSFAEDFDLTVKLLGAGWHVVYEPRAVVYTEAPERTLELLRQRYRWTRGSLQALRKRRHRLLSPWRSPLRFIALWYLCAEYLALPALHIGAQLLFVGGELLFEIHPVLVCWWLQLIVLESAVLTFCIAIENESPWLIALSPIFRAVYMVVLDTARLLAAAEEFAAVRMSWDKLSRLGKLKPAQA